MMPALDVVKYQTDQSYRAEMLSLVGELGVGGLITFNGTIAATRKAVDDLQGVAPHHLLIASDLEPGLHNRLLDATEFPHAMAIGRTTPELCHMAAECIGSDARASGIWVNFAPVCDINSNPRNPIINVRAFGETVEHVSRFAEAFIAGLHNAGVQAVIKHYPGHGDTSQDSHLTLPEIRSSMESLAGMELAPFKRAINSGADGVMVGHLLVSALDADYPVSLSSKWINGFLRKEVGNSRLIFTDALMMHAITKRFSPQQSAVLAVQAGCDVLVMPEDVRLALDGLVEASESTSGLIGAIEQAARRVDEFAMRYREGTSGSPNRSCRATALEIAEKSIAITGKSCDLTVRGKTAFVLLAGASDKANLPFLHSRLENMAAESNWDIIVDLNGSNTIIQQYDRVVVIMYSGVVSFQSELGDVPMFKAVIGHYIGTSNEIIGISLGNPYIWSELTEFSTSVNTFSNSPASVEAILKLLKGN